MMQDTVLLNDVHNKYNLSRSFFGLHFIIQFLTRVSSPRLGDVGSRESAFGRLCKKEKSELIRNGHESSFV